MPKEEKAIETNTVSTPVQYLSGDYYKSLTIFVKWCYCDNDDIIVVAIQNVAIPDEDIHDLRLRDIIGLQSHGGDLSEAISMIVELAQFYLSDVGLGMGRVDIYDSIEDVEYF